jgi:hypothetical protein
VLVFSALFSDFLLFERDLSTGLDHSDEIVALGDETLLRSSRGQYLLALDTTIRQGLVTRYEAVIQRGYRTNPPDPLPTVPK